MKNDRARIQIGKISQFGLLEMSRQRLRAGVVAGSTIPCPHCMGQGIVRSVESTALRVLRGLEEEGQKLRASAVDRACGAGCGDLHAQPETPRACAHRIRLRHDDQLRSQGRSARRPVRDRAHRANEPGRSPEICGADGNRTGARTRRTGTGYRRGRGRRARRGRSPRASADSISMASSSRRAKAACAASAGGAGAAGAIAVPTTIWATIRAMASPTT